MGFCVRAYAPCCPLPFVFSNPLYEAHACRIERSRVSFRSVSTGQAGTQLWPCCLPSARFRAVFDADADSGPMRCDGVISALRRVLCAEPGAVLDETNANAVNEPV